MLARPMMRHDDDDDDARMNVCMIHTMNVCIMMHAYRTYVQSEFCLGQPAQRLAGERGQRRLLPAHVELRQDRDEQAHGGRVQSVREPSAVPGVGLVLGGGRKVRKYAATVR